MIEYRLRKAVGMSILHRFFYGFYGKMFYFVGYYEEVIVFAA